LINIFNPSVGDEELQELKNVFESKWIGKGKYVKEFEKKLSSYLGVNEENITTTTSCSEALFAIVRNLGLNNDDEVIVPSISFPAVANSVLEVGAKLVLCDVDGETGNVAIDNIIDKVNPNTKALILTHYGGIPCDMDPIVNYCNKNNIVLIEDAACALASTYDGKPCGTIGDYGVWSFDAMKLITTGDGGAIYAKKSKSIEKIKEYLYLGLPIRNKTGLDTSNEDNQWWVYDIKDCGRRSIMNDISAAIGCSQFEKLNDIIDRRRQIERFYDSALCNNKEITRVYNVSDKMTSTPYFYTLKSSRRDELANYLKDNGIYSTFRYWPLHKINYYNDRVVNFSDKFIQAENMSSNCLNIPMHANLKDDEINYVCDKIMGF